MKNNVTFLKKGKNQIAVIQDKHLSGQADLTNRQQNQKSKDSGTIINDYDSQKTGESASALGHVSIESQQRTISNQGFYQHKQNLNE